MGQAIWTDCHDYDLIEAKDLDKHPEAYSAFCDTDAVVSDDVSSCGGMQLDDEMYFGGDLKARPWSFIHDNQLTVRKSYHLSKWNVVYDLGDGTGFYETSRLAKYCKGKLNDEWFMLNKNDNKILNSSSYHNNITAYLSYNQLSIAIFVVICIGSIAFYSFKNKKGQNINNAQNDDYGSL